MRMQRPLRHLRMRRQGLTQAQLEEHTRSIVASDAPTRGEWLVDFRRNIRDVIVGITMFYIWWLKSQEVCSANSVPERIVRFLLGDFPATACRASLSSDDARQRHWDDEEVFPESFQLLSFHRIRFRSPPSSCVTEYVEWEVLRTPPLSSRSDASDPAES